MPKPTAKTPGADKSPELQHPFHRDTVFKMLFTQNQKLLKHFIAEILSIAPEKIKEFRITNPELMPLYVDGKLCRLDINMEVDEKRIDLELQVEKEKDYPERTLYYCADLYTSYLQSGKDNKYGNTPQTIIVSIINFILFADCSEHVSRFSMLEETRHSQLTDKMRLVYYELPKLPEPTGPKDRLTLWLSLFKARTEDDLAKLESMGVSVIQEAIETYHSVVASPEFQELERQRRIAERDYRHDIAVVEERVKAEYQGIIAKERAEKEKEYQGIIAKERAEKEKEYQGIIAKERAEKEKERAERESLEKKIRLLEAQIEKKKQ